MARVEANTSRCPVVSTLNTLVRLDGNRWTGAAWTADINDLCPRTADVPADVPAVVAADLGLCVGPPPATAVLACARAPGYGSVYRSAPHRCRIEHRSDAYGDVVELRALRWRTWGRRLATARGNEGDTQIHVRVWRLRWHCGRPSGMRTYTRLRVTSARGVLTVRRAAC